MQRVVATEDRCQTVSVSITGKRFCRGATKQAFVPYGMVTRQTSLMRASQPKMNGIAVVHNNIVYHSDSPAPLHNRSSFLCSFMRSSSALFEQRLLLQPVICHVDAAAKPHTREALGVL